MGGISSKPEPGFPVDTSELDGDLRLPGEEEVFFSAQKVTEKDDEEEVTETEVINQNENDIGALLLL